MLKGLGLIAARQSGAVGNASKAQDLLIIPMLGQPPVLGFEVENLSEVHQSKENDQLRMSIHEGMAPMGPHRLLL